MVVVIIIMTFGVFEEIERLIEYIPIEYQDNNNNKNNLQGSEAKFAKSVFNFNATRDVVPVIVVMYHGFSM